MRSYYIAGKDFHRGIVKWCSEQGIQCRYCRDDNAAGTALVTVFGTNNAIAMLEDRFPVLREMHG